MKYICEMEEDLDLLLFPASALLTMVARANFHKLTFVQVFQECSTCLWGVPGSSQLGGIGGNPQEKTITVGLKDGKVLLTIRAVVEKIDLGNADQQNAMGEYEEYEEYDPRVGDWKKSAALSVKLAEKLLFKPENTEGFEGIEDVDPAEYEDQQFKEWEAAFQECLRNRGVDLT